MPEQVPQLTPIEAEKLRTILVQFDAERQAESTEFDLNNPPKKPYVHQDFPVMVYNHKRRKHRTVANQKELDQALKLGWKTEPYPGTHQLDENGQPLGLNPNDDGDEDFDAPAPAAAPAAQASTPAPKA